MGTLRFFEEVVSFKIRRTFGFADYTRKNKHIALFRIICIRLQGPKILLRQYIRNPESISKPRQKREAEPLNEKGESIPTHSFNMIAK